MSIEFQTFIQTFLFTPPPCSETPALQSTCCIPFLRLQPFLPLKCTMGFQGHTSSTLVYHSSFPATDLLFPKNRLPGVDRPWNEVGSICLVKEKQPQVPDIQSLLDEMLSPPQDPPCQSNSKNQRRESKMLPTKLSVVEKAFKAKPGWLLWLLWCLPKKILKCTDFKRYVKHWKVLTKDRSQLFLQGWWGQPLGVSKFWFQVSHWDVQYRFSHYNTPP